MAKSGQIESDIRRLLGSRGDEAEFRAQVFDAGTPTISRAHADYRDAMRWASGELLGSGGDYAEIYWRGTKVAEAYLQRNRLRKNSVRIVGEKPLPRRR